MKEIVLCLILDSRQNQYGEHVGEEIHCTVPYFGFKAKLKRKAQVKLENCTVPYFGFKAKLNGV